MNNTPEQRNAGCPLARILQYNTGKSSTAFQVMQAAIPDTNANILLVQEPPLLNGTPPTLDDFDCFPFYKQACRTVTYVRKKAFKSTSVISEPHANFLVVSVTLHSKDCKPPTINIANCYNRLQNRNWRTRDQLTHSLDPLFHEIFALADLVAGDMNKHYSRWEAGRQPSQWAQNLVDICDAANFRLAKTPNTPTSYPINNNRPAMLDLTFFNQDHVTVRNWHTHLQHKAQDHTLISYQAWPKTGTHPEYKGYNWKNTNWAPIAELLPAPEEVKIRDEQDFDHLYHLILRALRIGTPTRRVTKWSRPWWDPNLAEMRRIKNTTFREFRAGRTDKHTYNRVRNAYLWAIRKATQDHWNTVVENTNPSSL